MKNSNDTIGDRSRDLSVCSAVPQPLRHRVPMKRPPFSLIKELQHFIICVYETAEIVLKNNAEAYK
jgi:hypothetical protein